MKKAILLLVVLVLVFASAGFAQYPAESIKPGRIMINFTSELALPNISYDRGIAKLGIPALDMLAEEFGVYSIEKVFPNEHKPSDPLFIDLSRWYYFIFPQEVPVQDVLEAYRNKPYVEYVDYDLNRFYDYTPNDPMLNSCWHIFNTSCDSAWDITKGRKEIVIAIVDSGIDTAHVDLKTQMWINFGEDIDGDSMITIFDWNFYDDDGNGFIDDFNGWDFIDNDPYPYDADQSAQRGHGSHCAGEASAATNNATGISGAGFNTRLMTARCGTGGTIGQSLQGINYAANNGADVISMSYGSLSFWGPENNALQSAWQRGCILVGSAGNDNITTLHYPSAYQNVIGVGAISESNAKSGFSNYNSMSSPFPNANVDVMAPGSQIMGPQLWGGYVSWDGTSMATPIVAGILALLKHIAPDGATQQDIIDALFENVDDIYQYNPGFSYPMLGYGKVNAFKAAMSLAPYLTMTSYTLDDDGNNDGRADPGETIQVNFTIANDPRAQTALEVSGNLTTTDEAVTFQNSSASFGAVIPGFSASNANAFVFTVGQTYPHFAEFELTLTNGAQSFVIPLDIELGRPEVLFVDDDSLTVENIYQNDFDYLGYFIDTWHQNTSSISQSELNRYKAIIWSTGSRTSTLNSSEQTLLQNYLSTPGKSLFLTSTNAGQDIGSSSFYNNYLHASYNSTTVTGFFVDGVAGNVIGDMDSLMLLGGSGSGNNTSLDVVQPLNGAETCFVYRTGALSAGITYEGDYKLVYFGFALDAASGLMNTSTRAEILAEILDWFEVDVEVEGIVETIPTEFTLRQNFPNPFNPETSLTFALPVNADIQLKVFNASGQQVAVLFDGQASAGSHTVRFNGENLSSGIYFAVMQSGDFQSTRKMLLLK